MFLLIIVGICFYVLFVIAMIFLFGIIMLPVALVWIVVGFLLHFVFNAIMKLHK